LLLKNEGFEVITASSPAGALAAAETQELDVVLVDLNYARDTTSGREGLDLLSRLQAVDPSLPVVVMTAWATVDGAVEAIRRGARDYVQKPWENQRLVATLRNQVTLGSALRKSRSLEAAAARSSGRNLPPLFARSRVMQPVLRLMERVGPSDANVLVTGPHGSGKEVVARWLHTASLRSSKPFVAVNGGGLADGVFESELFGHVRGAFTDAVPAEHRRDSPATAARSPGRRPRSGRALSGSTSGPLRQGSVAVQRRRHGRPAAPCVARQCPRA
ncbi:MAG: hypothetical protein QOI66_2637, partial [Myxococcales bacterium]|nr:hypothetical protein [Myxococcales bacterium]